jgi:hypothetical protein
VARPPGAASVLAFAAGIILLVILASYALGYIAGKMILGVQAL